MESKVGWRKFKCEECDNVWEWPCRDHTSYSGETCPNCGEWTLPEKSWKDESIPVDKFGNLLVAYNWTGKLGN